MNTQLRCLVATAAVLGALAGGEARAQTINPPVAAGTAPFAIAVNPITNKVYVTNEADNTLSVMNGRTLAITGTVPVGARPLWLGVNPETNRVYVAQFGNNGNAPHLVAVNGASDSVSSNITVGDVGWITINPVTNKTYTIRYGHTDEYTVTQGETFVLSESTREFTPVGHVIDPNRNILYTIDQEVPQVVPIDVTTDTFYPTRLCPDGAGGILPNPVPADTNNPTEPTCIALAGPPVGVTVNPVTGRAYAVSTAATNQIAVIRAISESNPMTATLLTPPGVSGAARAVAVNPVTNKIYAAFSDKVVVINGADNTMTVIASGVTGGPVAVGINTMTNKIYVPNDDGSLTLIDGATNATQNLAIPAGAKGVAVNPLTNTTFVLSPSGITAINGAAGDTVQSIPLTTAISHFAGDTTPAAGSFNFNVTASNGFPAPRKVYYQLDGTTGTWIAAGGSGPFSASFSGLSLGQHTVYAFATDALDAPSIMNDVQNNPIVGNVTSYTFTVDNSTPPPTKAMTRVDFNGDGKTDFILQGSDGSYKIVLMDGMTPIASQTVIAAGSGITLLRTGDFNGDSKTDLVVENPDTSISIWLMDSFTVTAQAVIMPGGRGWLPTQVGDFNGDGKSDLVWTNTDGSVGVWTMNGTAQITRATMLGPNNVYHVINVGDFDGDGKDDLLWRWNDGTTSMWLMDGSTIKTHGQIMPATQYWRAVRVADFDGDGFTDILWQNQLDGSSSFWLMNGMTIKQKGQVMPPNSTGWVATRVGDFNGDGKSDVLWVNNNGSVGLWLMNGLSILERKTELPAGNTLYPALLGDLDANHKSDIFYTDSSNNVTVWFMDGTSIASSGTYTPPTGYQLWTNSDINK
ncbi:MAG TPA: FG-GAP-like repeat-containing protein [Usitatibacter sp.]|nr:FG-GAP-like repeat-containing protein [Usitatibacter sp.]